MAFAQPTDVTSAYEGQSPPLPSSPRIVTTLAVVEARLRLLLPDLEARIAAADDLVEAPAMESDLAILTRDVVVRATIRQLTPNNGPEVQSTTQQAGPWSTTVRYTTDKSGFFSDDDLDLLRGASLVPSIGPIGTIHVGRPNWYVR